MKSPEINAVVIRHPGSPRRPSARQLDILFARAWQLAAKKYRITGEARLTADVIFVDDQEIARLNYAHIKHRGPTDAISFPLGSFDPERNAYHLGEVVVGFETARREAAERGIPFENEMSRYCVHGFLHLLGYDDSTPALRDRMFEVQEKALVPEKI